MRGATYHIEKMCMMSFCEIGAERILYELLDLVCNLRNFNLSSKI